MVDFLTRLVSRTLGLEPTVQPILTSIYARGLNLPGDLSEDVLADSEPLDDRDEFQHTGATGDVQPLKPKKTWRIKPDVPLSSPPVTAKDSQAGPTATNQQPRGRPQAERYRASLPEQSSAVEGTEAEPPMGVRPPHRFRTAKREKAAPIVLSEGKSSRPAASAPALSEATALAQTTTRPVARQLVSSPTEQKRPAVQPTTEVIPSWAAAPEEGRGREQENLPPKTPEPSAGTPIIHVTIGQVEVRATLQHPAVPVASVSPPAPKLSLQDYLRLYKRVRQ